MGRSRRPCPELLADKLYAIRKHLGLTQGEMVKRLKEMVYPQTGEIFPLYTGHISEYERGVREPPLVVLLQYARLAQVPMELLIDDRLSLPPPLLIYFVKAHEKKFPSSWEPPPEDEDWPPE